jgi:benzil reductase ((S)-benzoin forming)
VFIHAAGAIGPIGFAGETDPREYRASVLLNAAAPLILGDAFLRAGRHLSCRRQLVLLSSGAAQRPYPGVAAYGAAKAAPPITSSPTAPSSSGCTRKDC